MRKTARLTILLLFVLTCLIPAAKAIVPQQIYGSSVDGTITTAIIPPCSTFNYAIDATLTFGLFGDTPVINQTVVDTSVRADRIGYLVTRNNTNSTEVWVYAFNAVTMALLSSVQLQAFGQLDYTNGKAAVVYNNDLYLLRIINGGRLGCTPARNCMSLTKIDSSGSISVGATVDLNPSITTQTVSDLYSDGTGRLYVGLGDGVNRRVAIFHAPSQAYIGISGALVGGSIFFAYNPFSATYAFAGFQNSTTVMRFPAGTTTADATSTYTFSSFNTLNGLSVNETSNYLLGGSTTFGGIAANMGYKDFDLVNNAATLSYLNAADGSQIIGGLYYDTSNNKLHSIRVDGGSGAFTLIRSTVNPLTIEQRFSLSPTLWAGQYRTYDYVQSTQRFYFGVTQGLTTGVVTRVKVCATGGPAA